MLCEIIHVLYTYKKTQPSWKPCTQTIIIFQLTMKCKLSTNDSLPWNQKYYSNIHSHSTQHRDILWYITYDDAHMCRRCILDNLPVVWKHPNIVLLMSHFFSLFGSCQRSTSNSMQWNQALLSMSHWCITRPGRSRLCKHTLSKPIEDVGRWPHQ